MGKKAAKAAARAAAATAAAAGAQDGGGGTDGKAASGGKTAAALSWADVDADPVGFLVAPESAETFFKECWEREPRVFRATPARKALAAALPSLPSLLGWLRRCEAAAAKAGGAALGGPAPPPLVWGRDVNAAVYRGGRRETPNGDGEASADALRAAHDAAGATLQVHQPQRWDDAVWRLLAALESKLGVLVGSNLYLTPPGAQGLAPHHDDVELWVIQTAGTKRWRCHAPLAGHALPSAPSGDLPDAVLGPCVLEAELGPGDVLFLPRGTIHAAKAGGDAASAHLTVSTYQRSSYAELGAALLGVAAGAQADAPERALPLDARRGPPPGLGLCRGGDGGEGDALQAAAARGLARALRAVADKLEASASAPEAMLAPAARAVAADFWRHRLPPHPAQLAPQGPAPELGDALWCRAAPWLCLVPADEEGGGGGGSDDDEDGGSGSDGEEGEGGGGAPVKLVVALYNPREFHMVGTASDGDDSDDGDDSLMGTDDDTEDDDDEEAPEAVPLDAAAPKPNGGGGGGKHVANACHDAACCDHSHGDSDEEDEEEEEEESDDDDGGGRPPLLPGIVFPAGFGPALRAFLAAATPREAVPVAELPLRHDADKLRLAFTLWAEGFAATARARPGGRGGEQAAARPPKKAKKKAAQH